MAHKTQPRQSKGTPVGGQFAGKSNPESEADLVDPDHDRSTGHDQAQHDLRELIDQRCAELKQRGFIQFSTAPNLVNPRSTAHRAEWWDQHMAVAEYEAPEGGHLQMPDDWTPSQQDGRSIDGLRRTHRVRYAGGGVAVRMPSVAAIKSYANSDTPGKEPGETFDVPVSADFPGGEVSGWVRVVPGSDGTWATQGLGFTHEQSAYVAESVQCVLEARHPTTALRQAGDLLERRRRRVAQLGTKAEAVRSTWIDSTGYDSVTGTLVVTAGERTGSKRVYGFATTTETFRILTQSPAPGKLFNRFIKGRAPRVEVTECSRCGRYTTSPDGHRCPPSMSQRRKDIPRSNRVRQYVFGGAESPAS